MEHRIKLTKEEVNILSGNLNIFETNYVRDEYTGKTRIRTDKNGITRKEYLTPVKGIIHRFSSRCELGNIKNIWFEYKWTKDKERFEIEFESEIPEEFKSRRSIAGWDILN